MSMVEFHFNRYGVVATAVLRGRQRTGTAVLLKPRDGTWHLVPSYKHGSGIKFEWDEALPMAYSTQKAAREARKALRINGVLP